MVPEFPVLSISHAAQVLRVWRRLVERRRDRLLRQRVTFLLWTAARK